MQELHFWNTQRRVAVKLADGTEHQLYQYRANSSGPRPESYREDVEMTKQMTKQSAKPTLWKNLASAAESGWDFSSRWFADGKTLATIETTNIVEVDLNAFVCWNLNILQFFHGEVLGELFVFTSFALFEV